MAQQAGFDPNAPMRVEGRPERKPKSEQEGQAEAQRREVMKQRLEALVGRLTTLALEQVSKKTQIEERWLIDLRAYHGRYDVSTEATLNEGKKSRLYVNMTRPKTHAWEAKLSDMLFPTDGTKNWGIKPTPVPELQIAIARAQPSEPNISNIGGQGSGQPAQPQPQVPSATNPLGGPPAQAQAQVPAPPTEAQIAAEIIAEAKIKAKAMEMEIADQLKEAKYDLSMREALHDACKLGIGISKGPTLTNKTRRRWGQETDEDGNVVQILSEVEDPRPDNSRVDPWTFFPDMSASKMDQAGFAFERHLYNAKQVRALKKQPGFDHDELRKLLEEKPHEGYPSYVLSLRDITGSGQDSLKERFHIWEYHGPIEHDDLEAILESTGKGDEFEDYDPLDEINVIVWFSQGHLLKFGEQPMESGDLLYSAFSFEKDDTSLFGYGVPFLMRDSQRAINGAWRMVMDNGALSAGPQVVVDQTSIEPADGSWALTSRKVWWRKRPPLPGSGEPFTVHNIPNNQTELMAIINMARQFADDETSLPIIEQRGDERGSHVARSEMGIAMLMNAVNVVFRRVVKNFDDEMTIPNLNRQYDWNMQFNKKEHIKGDFEVDARGSSVLLVREIQSQNLMVMATNFTSHPVLGPMTKSASLYRKLAESLMMSPNDIVMTDDEIKAEQQKQDEAGEQDPEMLKLQMQTQIAEMESSMRLQVAQIEQQTKLMSLAETNNMTVAKLQVMLGIKQMETDSKERVFAAEAAVEQRMAAEGATGGSGGFLSQGGGG